MAGGDARAALTTLEMASEIARLPEALTPEDLEELGELVGGQMPALIHNPVITTATVLEATPRRSLPYDKKGDTHYDVISAFIKSMRGSDPDAAVYWLARMIEGGEDPKFIARRILIFASEDVGNADPQALLIAHAAFKATESIGYPECQLNLAQAALYMALAPKSNSATNAIFAALGEVRNGPARQVPNHLRDRHRPGSEDYGKYHYPHLDPRGWVDQQYLPDGLDRGTLFTPGERGWEAYRTEAVRHDRPKQDT
jgi:putative ATPase